jgi:hypothetical protein
MSSIEGVSLTWKAVAVVAQDADYRRVLAPHAVLEVPALSLRHEGADAIVAYLDALPEAMPMHSVSSVSVLGTSADAADIHGHVVAYYRDTGAVMYMAEFATSVTKVRGRWLVGAHREVRLRSLHRGISGRALTLQDFCSRTCRTWSMQR